MKQPRLDDEEEGNGSEAADQARPIIAEAEDDVEQDQHAQEHSWSAEAAPIGAAMIADPEGTAADDQQDRGRRDGVDGSRPGTRISEDGHAREEGDERTKRYRQKGTKGGEGGGER